jgi:uncharacterized protein (TIGR02679 family)
VSLPEWLTDPDLAPLWTAVHRRLEERGADWRGRASVPLSTEAERRALGLLLGRVIGGDRVTLDIADLDARLANAGGLLSVTEQTVGPVHDQRSARELARQQRDAPVLAAQAQLPELAWSADWLAFVRRTGPAPVDAARAATLLGRLLRAHEPVSRQDLAAGLVGDAHALDDGTALSSLVLRGLAFACGADPPDAAGQRRELWGAAGVLLDGVSTTCIVLRLPVQGGPLAVRLADGQPLHVSARDLRRAEVVVPSGTRVLVCENPRVLEAVADTDLEVTVVCSSGSPNLVVMDLLAALRRSDAVLRYHGDFDWPGIAIANRLVSSVGVQPWLMSESDYASGADSSALALTGAAVEAVWDAGLRPLMQQRDRAVHEEAVLPALIEAMSSCF